MANTLSVAPFNIGSTISGSGHLSVIEEFKSLPGLEFPLVSRIGYGKSRKMEDTGRLRWVTSEYLPTKATLNEDLDSSETGVDVTSATAATVQNGQVIRIDSELMQVTSGAGTTTWTVERDYAGSSAATHSNGADILIMAPAMQDDDVFVESAKLRGQFAQNYFQQCQYLMTQTELQSGIVSYLTGGESEMAHEKKKKKQIEVSRQFEATLLYSLDQAPTSSAAGNLSGLIDLFATNVTNVASQALSLTTLENMASSILDNDSSLDHLTLCCSRKTRRILNALFLQQGTKMLDSKETELGVRIDRFQGPLVDYEMMVVPQLVDNRLLVVSNFGDMEIVPLDTDHGGGWNEVTFDFADNNALISGWGYWGIFTLVVMNEKRHGQIHTFDTTLSSYGAI